MKLTIEKDQLAAAVGLAARALPARPTAPVLAGLRLDAGPAQLAVSAFDYEVSSRDQVPADVDGEGTVIVPGRLLAEIVRSLPAGPVTLSADDTRLSVRCGASSFTLLRLPGQEYPQLPAMPPLAGTFGSDALARAVAQVTVAAGKDDTLPALTGIRAEFRGAQVTLVATDRYRLAVRHLPWEPQDPEISADLLIPARVLTEVTRAAAAAAQTTVHLNLQELGEGQAADYPYATAGIAGFGAGPRQLTTRLLAGEYPKYANHLPTEFSGAAELPAADFADAVKRVALVAERNTPVRVTFKDGTARLEAGTGDEAQGTEELDVKFDGGAFATAFNPGYLVDGVLAAGTPEVRISLLTPAKPVVITGPGGPQDGYQYLLMPIRSAG